MLGKTDLNALHQQDMDSGAITTVSIDIMGVESIQGVGGTGLKRRYLWFCCIEFAQGEEMITWMFLQ